MTFRDDATEMQKRVADAIFMACSGYMLRINCDTPARAAIAAMRDPTATMLSEGDSMMPQIVDGQDITTGYDALKEAWPVMIDAALAPS